jgi:hypothetical protein
VGRGCRENQKPARKSTDGFIENVSAENGERKDSSTTNAYEVTSRRSCDLFQRAIDRREFGVEGGAKAVDRSDDREADARGDQAVLDRGSGGLVGPKFCKNVLHCTLPPGNQTARSFGVRRTYVGTKKLKSDE